MKHVLIVGARHVGKSTLIRKIVRELGCSVCGYETKKEDGLADEGRGSPVYIYRAGQPHVQTPENLLGYCKAQRPAVSAGAFDRAAHLLSEAETKADLILMDEIGFMESSSEVFCREILRCLDEDRPVLAAVKEKDTPFLRAVRSHPNCQCFYITEENRNALPTEVLEFLRERSVPLAQI